MSLGEVIMVRHAEAWCNVHDVVGGPRGCRGLTRLGCEQAARVADRLGEGSDPVDVLYSSPRLRAVETAHLVSARLGLPVRIDEELREHILDPVDGEPRSVLSRLGDGNPFLEPWRPAVPGAESWSALRARVGRVLHRLIDEHPRRRLVIVCHGETINAAVHVFLGLPDDWPGPLPLTVPNTAVVRWRRLPADDRRPDLGARWHLDMGPDGALSGRA